MNEELAGAVSSAITSGTHIYPFCLAFAAAWAILLYLALRRWRKPRARRLQLPARVQAALSAAFIAVALIHLAHGVYKARLQGAELAAAAEAGELAACPGVCFQTGEGAWRSARSPLMGEITTFIVVPHDPGLQQRPCLLTSASVGERIVAAIEVRGYNVARPFEAGRRPDARAPSDPAVAAGGE